MRNDNLEQFIQTNREAFDDATPSLKAWAEIDRAMQVRNTRPKVTIFRALRVAAAVAVLLCIGGIGGSYLSKWGQGDAVAIIEEVNPQYLELEQQYREQIDKQIQQLVKYEPNSAVIKDMKQMDAVMEELKKELSVAPKGQEAEIISTMIHTYQTKVQILEQVLQQVRQSNPETIKPKTNEVSL
jgi:DNA-binding transcriptional MerR regulator